MKKSLMIVAGEVSGDMLAARLVSALKEQAPEVECWGIGGPRLRACGMQTYYDVREMAVMGLSEVLRRYFFFRRVFYEMIRLAEEKKPDAVLLVDYPGFNVRLAEQLHRRGIKTLYYISPQVWAWHRSRIPKLAAILDRLMVIFPFEVDVFSGTGLAVDFVGHPLVVEAEKARREPLLELPWTSGRRVALLPGSRRHEVSRILPCLLEAAVLLEKQNPDVCFILAAPSEEIRDVAEQVMARQTVRPAQVAIVVDQTRQVLRQARAAMVASGTATIEATLQHCPMIVVYKTAWPTYLMARWLVRGVKHIGMVNVVAGRLVCPEFIQHQAQPEAMAAQMIPLLDDSPERAAMLNGLNEVCDALSVSGHSSQAAELVLRELTADRP